MSDFSDFLMTGDLIAGRYNPNNWAPLELSKIAGSTEETSSLFQKYNSAFATVPGVQQIEQKAKSSKKKTVKKEKSNLPTVNTNKSIDPEILSYYKEEEEQEDIDAPSTLIKNNSSPVVQTKITFQNQFGMIRLDAEQVLYSTMGILVIFSNEDKLSFIPKVGDTLEFSDNGIDFISVLYPGTLFELGIKKIMVLFKAESNEEE